MPDPAYLNENEDVDPEKQNETLSKVSAFFSKAGDGIEVTASKVWAKTSEKSKRAGTKIAETYKEIKESETTKKAKLGFMRFATKVKGLFSKEDEEEKKEDDVQP